jgi:hypothetical protein
MAFRISAGVRRRARTARGATAARFSTSCCGASQARSRTWVAFKASIIAPPLRLRAARNAASATLAFAAVHSPRAGDPASALVHGYSVATAWATGMLVAGALAAALLMNATRLPSYP